MSRPILLGGLRSQWRDMVSGTVLAGVHQGCEALVAVVIGVVIDQAISRRDLTALGWSMGLLVAVFLALALSAAVGYYQLGRAEQRIEHDLRVAVVERAVAPHTSTRRPVGEVLTLATSDAARVSRVAGGLAGAVSALVALGVGAALLLVSSWQLAAVVLIGLPVVVIGAQWLAGPLASRSAAEQEAAADTSAVAVDLVTGLRVLRGIGGERAAATRFAASSRRTATARIRASRWAGLHAGVTGLVGSAFLVIVAWWGGLLALQGEVSIGQLVAAVGLGAFLTGPLARLLELPSNLAVARASATRLADLLDDHSDQARQPSKPLDGADLQWRGLRAATLAGVELDLRPGEWLGIVTGSPSDAASVVDVLAGRAPATGGTMRMRGTMLVADHDAALFDGSVLDNVTAAARPGLDLEELLEATAVRQVLDTMPTPDARVGESGRFLSGGQRQRVALARAIAADPPILVLHEPTTAIDSVTELHLVRGVRRLRERRSTVVVTNSTTWLRHCDRIVVIDEGRVVTQGGHRVLAADERYVELVS